MIKFTGLVWNGARLRLVPSRIVSVEWKMRNLCANIIQSCRGNTIGLFFFSFTSTTSGAFPVPHFVFSSFSRLCFPRKCKKCECSAEQLGAFINCNDNPTQRVDFNAGVLLLRRGALFMAHCDELAFSSPDR